MVQDAERVIIPTFAEQVFWLAAWGHDPSRVAWRWPGTLGALAGALGCGRSIAAAIGLCQAPETDADVSAWTDGIVARFHLDPARVAAVGWRLAPGR